jgi:hypothetical protein
MYQGNSFEEQNAVMLSLQAAPAGAKVLPLAATKRAGAPQGAGSTGPALKSHRFIFTAAGGNRYSSRSIKR